MTDFDVHRKNFKKKKRKKKGKNDEINFHVNQKLPNFGILKAVSKIPKNLFLSTLLVGGGVRGGRRNYKKKVKLKKFFF